MSENEPAKELVSSAELEELANLFDRSEFAIDPLSADCRAAESEFSDKVKALYDRVRLSCPDLSLSTFASATKTRCRAFLRNKKN